MAGDYSRITFDPTKHYTRVLMQQGRVQLDSDWNEQGALIAHRIETESRDVIGINGAPKAGGNFRLGVTPDGGDLTIAPGRFYVDGLLCELEARPVTVQAAAGTTLTLPSLWLDGRKIAANQWLEIKVGNNAAQILKVQTVGTTDPSVTLTQAIASAGTATVRRVTTYLTQPDWPGAPAAITAIPDGRYLAFLDVFEREISAIDDPTIREVALGGPDTARRLETVWRLRLLTVSGGATCATVPTPALQPTTGMMAAQTEPPDDEPDPCLLPPSAGYRGLENQLYRIEIQTGGQLPSGTPPTFKWSRDNAAVEAAITNVSGTTVTVSEIGKDDVLRFSFGDWVEIVDDGSVLSGNARPLALINGVTDASREITFAGAPVIPPAGTKGLRLRKWDQRDAATAAGLPITADTWLEVEAGVQVRFSPGLYNSGDYWVVPARTATADVQWPPFEPTTDPVPQPPLGVRHHYARVGIVAKSGSTVTVLEDCRELFPPLTDIWAEDVNFDNTHCQLPQANTVQEAIDELCSRSDIRIHNKYLHGWGVVCGLQVRCRGEATVRVLPGYALDCEGYDIHLRNAVDLNIYSLPYSGSLPPGSLPSGSLPSGSLPPGQRSLPGGGREKLSLVLERGANGQPQFRLRDHDHRESLRDILDGTLLMEFYEHCLKKFSDYFQESLDPRNEDVDRVSESQRRIAAIWNLLIQLWNPTNGGRVYLSQEEHNLLVGFYGELLELSASTTFCELLDDLRDPPSYPFSAVPMRTIFGKSNHSRLRAAPSGSAFVTMGSGDKIDVFIAGQMQRQIQFYVNGATVRDAAFISTNTIAVAATLPGGGSAIGVHDLTGGTWRQQTSIPNQEIVTLGFSQSRGMLLGVALGQGLMNIQLGSGAQPLATRQINTRGHMVLFDTPSAVFAFCTSRNASTGTSSEKYNMVSVYFVGQNEAQDLFLLGREGDDDIALAFEDGQPTAAVVVDPMPGQTTKQLYFASPRTTTGRSVDLLENTSIRLANLPGPDNIVIAYEDTYHVRQYRDGRVDPEIDMPVQICPTSIAATQDRLLVLNAASRTTTEIRPPMQFDIPRLREYRMEMLNAFIDLGAAVFQSIKDCFCERLLIDCQQCEPDDVIILGCIELRDGRVRQICNLEGRKYVKTFRTVEYWLSLIPVLPLLRWGLEKFCCMDLSRLLRRFDPPTEGENRFDCGDALPLLSVLEKIDFDQFRRDTTEKVTYLRKIGVQSAGSYERRTVTTVTPNSLVGQDAVQAEAQLKSAGINVSASEEYDPTLGRKHLTRATRTVREGMDVTIVKRNGKVAYIRETKPATDTEAVNIALATTRSDLSMMRADLDTQRRVLEERQAAIAEAMNLRTEVAALRGELESVRAANQNAETIINELRTANIAADSRIGELNRRTSELLRTAADVETLKTTVERLGRRPPIG